MYATRRYIQLFRLLVEYRPSRYAANYKLCVKISKIATKAKMWDDINFRNFYRTSRDISRTAIWQTLRGYNGSMSTVSTFFSFSIWELNIWKMLGVI